MKISLFYMVQVGRNHGAGAFTMHLHDALVRTGHEPTIYCVNKKTTSLGVGKFATGLPYVRVGIAGALELARSGPSIIAVSHSQHFPEETIALLCAGVPWVLHGVGNLPERTDVLGAMRHAPIATIRTRLQATARELLGIETVVTPHPYVRSYPTPPAGRRDLDAVCCARVDFVKHTEIVAEANTLLMPDRKISIYGDVNRLYEFHSLNAKTPNWRDAYCGKLQLKEGAPLAARANWCVDMTYWKNDNGGTQYTFFEAWDAGTPLIVHQKWRDDGEPTSQAAHFINSASELAALVSRPPVFPEDQCIVGGGNDMLRLHCAERTVPHYMKLMGA